MIVDTSKEQICVNQMIGEKRDTINIEGDVIVNDVKPDILNTISTSGNIFVNKKEFSDGKLKLTGNVNVYIIYFADDENGSVRSLNTNLDFSHILDFENCNETMNSDEEIVIKNIECKVLNSRKINVKVFLEINSRLYSNDNIELIQEINNIDGMQLLNNNCTVNSLMCKGETKVIAKDTLILDNTEDLAEILKADITIINKDTKISYNKVLVKADVEIKIMYLTEDNRIKIVDTRIPVMGFIDTPNITEDNLCDTKYKLKNFVINPNNTDDHSVYVEAEVGIMCYVFEKKEIKVIQDLYSTMKNTEFTQKRINAMIEKNIQKEICNIKTQIDLTNIVSNQLYDASVNPTIINMQVLNNQIVFEGEIISSLLYETDNNRLEEKDIKIPFNYTMNLSNLDESSKIITNIEVKTNNFIILDGGHINVEIDLEFIVDISKNVPITVINEVDVEDDVYTNMYSMVIYFVKSGDTLWKIAKDFKSTVEDISRINNIENSDNLNVGMQLFIPKYVKRNVAV